MSRFHIEPKPKNQGTNPASGAVTDIVRTEAEARVAEENRQSALAVKELSDALSPRGSALFLEDLRDNAFFPEASEKPLFPRAEVEKLVKRLEQLTTPLPKVE